MQTPGFRQPWENFQDYWGFSPLSLVGNIETPTMVCWNGGLKNSLRAKLQTALSRSFKIRKIPTVLVEIPGASHNILNVPVI